MRKILSSFIFIVAIVSGLGVGYGAVHTSGALFKVATAYVAEVTTDLTFAQAQEGGPSADEDDSEDKKKEEGTFYVTNQNKKPKISAYSYLAADLETGKILISKNISNQMPIASVTKLMTALVADETLGLDAKTTVNAIAINTYGTQGDLKKGESYSVSELFYPLLLESSNDAAEALAMAKDRASFISDMNGKAKSIGMVETQYDDASGLSYNNKSTATDLLKLTQYIMSYRSYIFDLTTEKQMKLGKKTWFSNSKFRNDEEYVGGKNGFTDEALKTQVALFEQDFDGEKRTIVYIILRSNDIAYDINMLRDFVHKNVEYERHIGLR
jgi:serine-type D-Ala-D-Ala carboxypeptidase (penicillin-binding protein 5/6)